MVAVHQSDACNLALFNNGRRYFDPAVMGHRRARKKQTQNCNKE
jgi:hypothetical protein